MVVDFGPLIFLDEAEQKAMWYDYYFAIPITLTMLLLSPLVYFVSP